MSINFLIVKDFINNFIQKDFFIFSFFYILLSSHLFFLSLIKSIFFISKFITQNLIIIILMNELNS